MSDAAVGSVSHILKTAFKDVYESNEKADEAKKARAARDLIVAEKLRKKEEARRIAEEENARRAEEEEAAAAATKKPVAAAKGGKEDKHAKAVAEVEEEKKDSEVKQEPEPEEPNEYDDPNHVANYYTSFEKVTLNGVNQNLHSAKVTAIESNLVRSVEEAKELSAYLVKQRIEAWEKEEEEQDHLKKQGILVGQHIPSLPSKLALDEDLMTHKYGTYSSNLVIAHTLVQQNLENSMRRTGILPISDVAEKKKLSRTSNNTDEKPSKMMPPKIQDTAERRMANENILKSINRKLNYLRNPHNNPYSVGKTLIQGVNKDNSGPVAIDVMNTNKKKVTIATIPLFVADPPTVTFSAYDSGQSYTCLVKFRNVSTISRSLRVIPPKSSNYSITPLKYPSSSKAGMVAPGMSVWTVVTFTPDSIGNYEDNLQCATEGGKFSIPIVSQREAPKLSIPSTLNVGACLVGDATRVVINCHNSGGSGRFRLLRPEDYPNVPTDINWDTIGCMRMSPFTVYPVQFVLNRNESVDITIEYVPLTAGGHTQEFVMLCDNCQVRTFEITGESKLINVVTSEINTVHVDAHDHNIKRDLNFSNVFVGTEDTQEVSISNTTGIPLEFEWIWVAPETKDRDLTKLGQERIMRREAEEEQHKQLLDQREAALAAGEPDPMSHLDLISADDYLSTAGMTIASTASSAANGPFEIAPSRGVLSQDGDQSFTITYSPTSLAHSSAKAVLMLIKVPMVALVIPGQAALLKKLSTIGHGVFIRLLSWLREIGQPTLYNTMFGIAVEPMKLLSLHQLVSLVMDHLVLAESINDGDTDVRNDEIAKYHTDILRFLRMAKLIANHGANNISHATSVYVDPKTNLVPTDDIQLVDETEPQLVVGFYLWKIAEPIDPQDHGSGSEVPSMGSFSGRGNKSQREIVSRDGSAVSLTIEQGLVRVPPIMIDRFPKQGSNLGSVVDQHLPIGLGDGISELSLHDLGGQYQQQQRNVPPIVIEDENYDRDVVLQELHSLQQDPMSQQIWLDYKHALMLYGNSICSFLNELVKHEAVEYIQQSEHTYVACVSQKVSGQGKAQRIIVDPPKCVMPGWYAINQMYTGSVKVINTSSVMTQVEVLLDNIKIYLMTGPSHEAIVSHEEQSKTNKQHNLTGEAACEVPRSAFTIEFQEQKIIVMPDATVEVCFSLTAHMTGMFEICVPLRTQNSCILADQFFIKVGVIEPTVRFTAPEIDVGLVGVGVEERKMITFTNDSDIPARYFFKVNQDVDKETLALSLVAAKRSESVRDGNGRSLAPSVAGSRKNSARGKSLVSARGGKSLVSARSQRTLGSARSSKYLSGDDDEAQSTDSYAIENPLALLAVEPPAGLLGPRETKTVTVSCSAGRMPQRVRATLECLLYDSQGTCVLSSQYLSLRGEVQAPKATLYPMSFDLGKLYVGNSVNFKVTLENMSNLPTKYRFERPGGDAPNYKLTVDNPTGTLPPKSKVVVGLEFEPYTTGLCDDVMAVKVFGIQQPLGFSLRAFVKGIQLGFTPLAEGVAPPAPLAKPTDARYPAPGNPPEPPQIAPMDFGNDVPLYERRVRRLAIRNFSAIAVSYSFKVKKFQVGPNVGKHRDEEEEEDGEEEGEAVVTKEQDAQGSPVAAAPGDAGDAAAAVVAVADVSNKPPTPSVSKSAKSATAIPKTGRLESSIGGAVESSSASSKAKSMLLVPHEDGVDIFHSAAGKKHMGFRLQRDDDKNYMTLGLGAAYYIETGSTGVLAPWAVQVITVRTFNDMPGIYSDDLICEVKKYQAPGTANVTTLTTPLVFNIPLRMSIRGCPLFIEKDVVGMSVIRPGHPNAATALGKPLLQLGHECVDSEPLVRDFYVRNNGSKAGVVKWKVRSLNNNVHGPIKIELKTAQIGTREDGSVRYGMKMSYQFWDDLAKDSSFKVHPVHATIPPFGRQTFTVTLYRTHSEGTENGLLTASVKYDGGEKPGTTGGGGSVSVTAVSSIANLSIQSAPAAVGVVDGGGSVADGSVGGESAAAGNQNNESTNSLGALVRGGSTVTQDTRESQVTTAAAGGGGRSTASKSEGTSNFELTLYLQGDLTLPAIRIDKSIYRFDALDNPTISPGGIKLSTTAPVLFNRGVVTKDSSVCVKQLTLSNPLQASLVFTTAVEGPFVLKPTSGSDDGELQAKKSITTTYSNPDHLDMTIPSTTRFIASAASVGKIYNLLPQAAAKFAVAFVPKRALRESLLDAATSSTSGQIPEALTTHTGKLILSFSKGQCLHIPLTAKITTPFIFISVPRVYFGVCAVTKNCEGTILLCNPTNVNATWRVEHVPETTVSKGTTSSIKPSSIRVKGFEPKGPPQIDDPSVFVITPDQGRVQGPTVSVTAAMAAPPTDVNRK